MISGFTHSVTIYPIKYNDDRVTRNVAQKDEVNKVEHVSCRITVLRSRGSIRLMMNPQYDWLQDGYIIVDENTGVEYTVSEKRIKKDMTTTHHVSYTLTEKRV